MNKKQFQAATKIKKALEGANKVGLNAGIFSGWFCIWPSEYNLTPGPDFFEELEAVGFCFEIDGMWLDGGAGV